MKYIKIGDMSTIAGISPSGLRKYEKYGIIEPEIDPDTGHRVRMQFYGILTTYTRWRYCQKKLVFIHLWL